MTADLGDLAREHAQAFADLRLEGAELARLEAIADSLHQRLDAYLAAARAVSEK